MFIDNNGTVLILKNDLTVRTVFQIESPYVSSVWNRDNNVLLSTKNSIALLKPFLDQTEDQFCEAGLS